MAFIEICANTSSSGRMRGRRSDTTLTTMAVTKSGIVNGVQRYQLSIRLSQDLVKQMRWQLGDRIKVLADDKKPNMLLLQRVTTGGWALSTSGAKEKFNNKLRIQISNYAGVNMTPGARYKCKGFSEDHGGAVLLFTEATE